MITLLLFTMLQHRAAKYSGTQFEVNKINKLAQRTTHYRRQHRIRRSKIQRSTNMEPGGDTSRGNQWTDAWMDSCKYIATESDEWTVTRGCWVPRVWRSEGPRSVRTGSRPERGDARRDAGHALHGRQRATYNRPTVPAPHTDRKRDVLSSLYSVLHTNIHSPYFSVPACMSTSRLLL